jgi:YhcG PDDEXK nuclease domain
MNFNQTRRLHKRQVKAVHFGGAVCTRAIVSAAPRLLQPTRLEPEYLGKLSFYLEALDRDVRKPHENPAIGVLLCASKDDEVVEYALSRTASPALIAQYEMQLPDKALLQSKLHEFYLQNTNFEGDPK